MEPNTQNSAQSPLGEGQPHPAQAVTIREKTDVLGIVSLVMAFTGLQLFGVILGLVGASKAKKEGRSATLSTIGWIMNLIFLVITVAIIALVFLAVPALQKNSRVTQSRNDMSYIVAQLNEFKTENGYYPSELSELGSLGISTAPGGNDYRYKALPEGCTRCEDFELSTTQEDGQIYKIESD